MPSDLKALLDHLARDPAEGRREQEYSGGQEWQGWLIRPAGGFHTHPVYRATGDQYDLAVKFVAQGPRDGAGREYESLLALRLADLDIAPEPLLLDRDSYEMPVVVTTWLQGEVRDEPPTSDEEWLLLARHLAVVSGLTPLNTRLPLRSAVVSMANARDAAERFKTQVLATPSGAQPGEIVDLARRIEQLKLPKWTAPRHSLIRCDPNILNFVRRPGTWASVDWEDSGWGDPAADMGDLMAHPAYQNVPRSRWKWLAERYSEMLADPTAPERMWSYYVLTVAWWAAVLANKLYRLSVGDSESQYIGRPTDWKQYLQERYDWYCIQAGELLATDSPW